VDGWKKQEGKRKGKGPDEKEKGLGAKKERERRKGERGPLLETVGERQKGLDVWERQEGVRGKGRGSDEKEKGYG